MKYTLNISQLDLTSQKSIFPWEGGFLFTWDRAYAVGPPRETEQMDRDELILEGYLGAYQLEPSDWSAMDGMTHQEAMDYLKVQVARIQAQREEKGVSHAECGAGAGNCP